MTQCEEMMFRIAARLTNGDKWGTWDLLRVPVVGDVLVLDNGSSFCVEKVIMRHIRAGEDLNRRPGAWVLVSDDAAGGPQRDAFQIPEAVNQPFGDM
jgi:hypothetical protein